MGSLLAKLRGRKSEERTATEQSTDEGLRRDVPEKQGERYSTLEPETEVPPKYENEQSKVSEPPIQPKEVEIDKLKSVQEQKSTSETPLHDVPSKEAEKVEKSLLEDHHKVPEAPVRVQQSTETEITKSSPLQEEKTTITISKDENIKVVLDGEPKVVIKQEEITQRDIEEITSDVSKQSDDNVEGAVVKIQAGIRGYLTRKSLKEQRESQSPRKTPVSEDVIDSKESSVIIDEKKDDFTEKLDENKEKLEQTESIPDSPKEAVETVETDTGNEQKAAVKIQALYRGYRTRKNLNDISNELDEETVEELKDKDVEIEVVPQSEKELIYLEDESENPQDVIQNENGGTLHHAAVKIQSTFRGYQVRKQIKEVPKKNAEEEKEQLSSMTVNSVADEQNLDKDHTATKDGTTDEEGKAAVKIQAMYRGYKVRKEIKMIGEDDDQIEVTEHPSLGDDGIFKSGASVELHLSPQQPAESLLDSAVEERCFQKPLAPVGNEPAIPKSVSEPTVDLNSITESKHTISPSPSSD